MRGQLNLLVDTHILIWALGRTEALSSKASEMLQSVDNQVWVSAVSLWEIVIKVQTGKLKVPDHFEQAIQKQGFQLLPFSPEHALAVTNLPLYHRDPFDRALLAQAAHENFKFLTADRVLSTYKDQVDLVLMT